MSDERDEQRSGEGKKDDNKHIPLDVMFPVSGLTGAELNAQLRKRAEMRIQRRNDFYKGLVAFVAMNLLFWGIWFNSWHGGPPPFPWPAIITVGWLIGIVGEVMHLYQDSAGVVGRREDCIQREIEIEKTRLGLDSYNKPKRGQAMHLSDDGELVPDDESNVNTFSANR